MHWEGKYQQESEPVDNITSLVKIRNFQQEYGRVETIVDQKNRTETSWSSGSL